MFTIIYRDVVYGPFEFLIEVQQILSCWSFEHTSGSEYRNKRTGYTASIQEVPKTNGLDGLIEKLQLDMEEARHHLATYRRQFRCYDNTPFPW